jgi:FAD synthetase
MRVAVFGTFDKLHPGHLAMLREARLLGDELTAIVARDEVVSRLKGRMPSQALDQRLGVLKESGLVDEAVPGDEGDGEYQVIDQIKPDVVAFGYDQQEFRENFLKFLKRTGKKVSIVDLHPFEPNKYKSSLV